MRNAVCKITLLHVALVIFMQVQAQENLNAYYTKIRIENNGTCGYYS
jgi:hypothetical protein